MPHACRRVPGVVAHTLIAHRKKDPCDTRFLGGGLKTLGERRGAL